MRVDTFLRPSTLRDVQSVAEWAEKSGFDGVGAPEITLDPFMTLTAATLATRKISLRTAIALAFPRSPMVTANLAWNLQTNSGGRFVLGLGTQVKGHNERRFSTPWNAPAPRLKEYVESLRAIWRCWENKEPLNYVGEHYQFTLMTPEFSPEPSKLPTVPIYLAAVRPRMMELAGEVADGIRLHGFCTRRYLEEVALPALEKGFAKSGRKRENFEICGGGFLATGKDEAAVAQMREWVRYRVAFYGSTRTYSPVMELHGWHDLAAKLHEMSKRGQWSEMAATIPDDVLDEFVAAGTYDNIGDAAKKRFGGLTDTIEFGFTTYEAAEGVEAALEALHDIPCRFTGQTTQNA